MRRALATTMAGLGLLAGTVVGAYVAAVTVTAGPAHAPVPDAYVCIEEGDGLPGWACYLRGDAPAVDPGQAYVVTNRPATLR